MKGDQKKKTQSRVNARTPRATNWSMFYAGTNGARDPGQWPSIMRRAWEARQGGTQPYPMAADNIQSRGSRAEQYSR